MNADTVIDALGQIDEDMLQQVDALRNKPGRPMCVRWAAMAACFVIVITAGLLGVHYFRGTDNDPDQSSGTTSVQLQAAQGVYVNHKLYVPSRTFEGTVTQESIGDFAGCVSLDDGVETAIRAYDLISGDDKINRIVVPLEDTNLIYDFYMYVPDGAENWPTGLFENVASVEIRDYGTWSGTVYLTLTDGNTISELLSFLADLGPTSTRTELNQHYYDLFKDQFAEGEIWIDESGRLIDHGEINKLPGLIHGEARRIVLIMEDNTNLIYDYSEGAGVITCYDRSHILEDDRAAILNWLIGLE